MVLIALLIALSVERLYHSPAFLHWAFYMERWQRWSSALTVCAFVDTGSGCWPVGGATGQSDGDFYCQYFCAAVGF